jgi:ammonia channel protein AmtB
MARNTNIIYLGMKIGLVITLPLIGFLILGLWIDDKIGTFPVCLIGGIISGIVAGVFMVWKVIIPYLDKKFKDNNK